MSRDSHTHTHIHILASWHIYESWHQVSSHLCKSLSLSLSLFLCLSLAHPAHDTFHWKCASSTSTKSRNSDFSVSRGKDSNWEFGWIWVCTKDFEFLDLVEFGKVAFSVESVTSCEWVTWRNHDACMQILSTDGCPWVPATCGGRAHVKRPREKVSSNYSADITCI